MLLLPMVHGRSGRKKNKEEIMNHTNVCLDCDVEFSVDTIYEAVDNVVMFCPFCGTTVADELDEEEEDDYDDVEDEDIRH